jgi:hypothetical protein
MIDASILAQLRQQLTQQNQAAMAEGKFGLAAQCARALDALQRWEEDGQQGDPPADVAKLLNINWADFSPVSWSEELLAWARVNLRRDDLTRAEVYAKIVACEGDPQLRQQA